MLDIYDEKQWKLHNLLTLEYFTTDTYVLFALQLFIRVVLFNLRSYRYERTSTRILMTVIIISQKKAFVISSTMLCIYIGVVY